MGEEQLGTIIKTQKQGVPNSTDIVANLKGLDKQFQTISEKISSINTALAGIKTDAFKNKPISTEGTGLNAVFQELGNFDIPSNISIDKDAPKNIKQFIGNIIKISDEFNKLYDGGNQAKFGDGENSIKGAIKGTIQNIGDIVNAINEEVNGTKNDEKTSLINKITTLIKNNKLTGDDGAINNLKNYIKDITNVPKQFKKLYDEANENRALYGGLETGIQGTFNNINKLLSIINININGGTYKDENGKVIKIDKEYGLSTIMDKFKGGDKESAITAGVNAVGFIVRDLGNAAKKLTKLKEETSEGNEKKQVALLNGVTNAIKGTCTNIADVITQLSKSTNDIITAMNGLNVKIENNKKTGPLTTETEAITSVTSSINTAIKNLAKLYDNGEPVEYEKDNQGNIQYDANLNPIIKKDGRGKGAHLDNVKQMIVKSLGNVLSVGNAIKGFINQLSNFGLKEHLTKDENGKPVIQDLVAVNTIVSIINSSINKLKTISQNTIDDNAIKSVFNTLDNYKIIVEKYLPYVLNAITEITSNGVFKDIIDTNAVTATMDKTEQALYAPNSKNPIDKINNVLIAFGGSIKEIKKMVATDGSGTFLGPTTMKHIITTFDNFKQILEYIKNDMEQYAKYKFNMTSISEMYKSIKETVETAIFLSTVKFEDIQKVDPEDIKEILLNQKEVYDCIVELISGNNYADERALVNYQSSADAMNKLIKSFIDMQKTVAAGTGSAIKANIAIIFYKAFVNQIKEFILILKPFAEEQKAALQLNQFVLFISKINELYKGVVELSKTASGALKYGLPGMLGVKLSVALVADLAVMLKNAEEVFGDANKNAMLSNVQTGIQNTAEIFNSLLVIIKDASKIAIRGKFAEKGLEKTVVLFELIGKTLIALDEAFNSDKNKFIVSRLKVLGVQFDGIKILFDNILGIAKDSVKMVIFGTIGIVGLKATNMFIKQLKKCFISLSEILSDKEVIEHINELTPILTSIAEIFDALVSIAKNSMKMIIYGLIGTLGLVVSGMFVRQLVMFVSTLSEMLKNKALTQSINTIKRMLINIVTITGLLLGIGLIVSLGAPLIMLGLVALTIEILAIWALMKLLILLFGNAKFEKDALRSIYMVSKIILMLALSMFAIVLAAMIVPFALQSLVKIGMFFLMFLGFMLFFRLMSFTVRFAAKGIKDIAKLMLVVALTLVIIVLVAEFLVKSDALGRIAFITVVFMALTGCIIAIGFAAKMAKGTRKELLMMVIMTIVLSLVLLEIVLLSEQVEGRYAAVLLTFGLFVGLAGTILAVSVLLKMIDKKSMAMAIIFSVIAGVLVGSFVLFAQVIEIVNNASFADVAITFGLFVAFVVAMGAAIYAVGAIFANPFGLIAMGFAAAFGGIVLLLCAAFKSFGEMITIISENEALQNTTEEELTAMLENPIKAIEAVINRVGKIDITSKTRKKIKRLADIVGYIGNMARTIGEVADLKIAKKWDKDGNPTAFEHLSPEQFGAAAENAGSIAYFFASMFDEEKDGSTLMFGGQPVTIHAIKEDMLEGITRSAKRKIKRLNTIVGCIGNMASTINQVANLKIAEDWDENGNPKKFRAMKDTDFTSACENSGYLVRFFADLFGEKETQRTFNIDGKKVGIPIFPISHSLLDGITEDVAEKMEALGKAVSPISNMITVIKDMANMQIPTGFDKEGKPTGFDTLQAPMLSKVCDNIYGMVSIFAVMFAEDSTFEKIKGWFGGQKPKSTVNVKFNGQTIVVSRMTSTMINGVSGDIAEKMNNLNSCISGLQNMVTLVKDASTVGEDVSKLPQLTGLAKSITNLIGGFITPFEIYVEDEDYQKNEKNINNFATKTLPDLIDAVTGMSEASEKLKDGKGINQSLDALGKFVTKISGPTTDLKKLKEATNLFKELANFSKNINGNFDKLADAINEKLIDAIEQLKEVLDSTNDKLTDVNTNASSMFKSSNVTTLGAETIGKNTGTASGKKSVETTNADGKQQIDINKLSMVLNDFVSKLSNLKVGKITASSINTNTIDKKIIVS